LSKARSTVKKHEVFALAHCVSYYKSLNTSANDVSQLCEFSGVAGLLKRDISRRAVKAFCLVMSLLTAISFAGVVVMLKSGKDGDEFEKRVALVMVMCVVQGYTIHEVSLEGLLSSIQTIYIIFAEKPASLSQEMPLIYQRLTRMKEVDI